jgi:hypothetical protein
MQQQGDKRDPGADQPAELELADGSRLVLDEAVSSPIVCRIEGADSERITLEDAMQLSGQPFAGYRLLPDPAAEQGGRASL